jgi:hypothetical protein
MDQRAKADHVALLRQIVEQTLDEVGFFDHQSTQVDGKKCHILAESPEAQLTVLVDVTLSELQETPVWR